MGREMFGVEWTGREPLTSLPHRLPVKRPATPSAPDLNRVELLLASVPGWKAQSTTIIGSATSVSPRLIGPHSVQGVSLRAAKFSDEDWRLAIGMSEKAYADALGPVQRFGLVQAEMTRVAEKGVLVFVSRPKAGGALHKVERDLWNTEALWSRYRYGQFKPSDPFSTGLHTEGTHFLFVSQESLQAWSKSRRTKAPPEGSANPGTVSPYIAVMLEVSRRLEITPASQPKKAVVELELQRAWQGDTPLSQNLIRAMATLIRDPESQAGRAAKPKGDTPKA
jgi:hypothetical protein